MNVRVAEWVEYFGLVNVIARTNVEDLIVVTFVYIFFKYMLLSSVVELIWPTQYFNKKHVVGYQSFRLRTYVETINKLRNFTNYYSVANIYFIFYYFIYRQ